ncbi:unnamed protein product, partial [Porites lobata]
FPNVEAKREEQRNCLKHVVGRTDVFAISPTGFGKRLIFQLFPRKKPAAMMGDVDEAVKSGSCEIAYCSHKSWLSKEWTKGLQKERLGKQVAAIAIDEVHSITE